MIPSTSDIKIIQAFVETLSAFHSGRSPNTGCDRFDVKTLAPKNPPTLNIQIPVRCNPIPNIVLLQAQNRRLS